MITPNRLKLAEQELATFDFENGYEIPKEIQEAEKEYFVTVCIKSRDNADGTRKVHEGITRYAGRNHWNEMNRQVHGNKQGKGKVFKAIYGGVFNKVVILHNPDLKHAPVKKEVKGLSPTHKSEAKKMKEEGQSNEDIAEALGVELERVNAYFA